MTDDAPVPPDPIVQTALQLLPVPDHGPAFWAELEAQLDLEVLAASHVEPALAAGPPVAEAPRPTRAPRRRPAAASVRPQPGPAPVLPPALRRRSNVLLAAIALVAAVIVLLAGGTLVRGRALDDLDATKASRSAERSTTTTASDEAADVPERAVLSWVRALHAGDMGAAWAALGPASQDHFGSQALFEQEASALTEGYGAWASERPDRVIITPVPSGGEAVLVIVTFVGTLRQEGVSERRADAFPVRLAGGAAVVEPYAFAGEVEIVAPGAPTGGEDLPLVQRDDELVVTVPRGVDAPTIRIDDGEPVVCGDDVDTTLTEPSDAPGQRCSYRPTGGLTVGRRVLTVAFASSDGSMVSARSVLFEVA